MSALPSPVVPALAPANARPRPVLVAGWAALAALWLAAAARGLPRAGELTGAVSGVGALAAWSALAVGLAAAARRARGPRIPGLAGAVAAHPTGGPAAVGILWLASAAAMAPLLTPWDPVAIDAGPSLAGPSLAHPLGTDEFGRDVAARLLYGGRVSLSIGLLAVGLSATVGTLVGGVAAYAGGLVDRIAMFGVDALLSLPRLVLLLTVIGLFRATGTAGLALVITVLGLTSWMALARVVRAEVLSLREREFVVAARGLGLSPARVLFRHVLPNATGPVIVYATLAIGSTMLAEATLSFLGLGVPPPMATWGVMVNDGAGRLRDAPWLSGTPGLAILLGVLCFNLLGDGLRDALDPRARDHT